MPSITELSAEANSYTFNPQISFASWAHVTQTLLRESRIYDLENEDIERAYVLYLRFADLVLNKMRKHPQFISNRKLYAKAYSQLPLAIERSEALKEKILDRQNKSQLPSERVENAELKVKTSDHNLKEDGKNQVLNKNKSLRNNEIPQTKEPMSLEEELDIVASQLSSTQLDVPQCDGNVLNGAYKFPDFKISKSPLLVNKSSVDALRYPDLYAQHSYSHVDNLSSSLDSHHHPIMHSAESNKAASNKAASTSMKPIASTACLESGEPLRQVFVPKSLRSTFLQIAQNNTRVNLETCGMLCGQLKRNAFFVTDLVIPHQKSTSDTCDTTNEEEIFDYVDKKELFIIGWIHTHPTQSCFMSSVDLHTHASYQLMLPEAVAIVCAPMHTPDWGAFRLTDPPGITIIRNCKLTGFHPHSGNEPIYRSAAGPGHYKEIEATLVTRDLRKNSV